jgi:hypothetical protein
MAGKRPYGRVIFRLNGPSDGIGGLVVGAKAADLFPTSALGSMMRSEQMDRGGMPMGPLVGGLPFDLRGDYFVAFILAAVLMVVGVGSMWGVSFTGSQRCTLAEGWLT